MNLYAIMRRRGWRTPQDLEQAAKRSTEVGGEMADQVRWIRSYALEEDDGSVGTVCIYEATGPEAAREHATRAGIPADEVIPIADTIVVRPDPERASV
jgi:sporulation protein YlmC with PRC-barrel domain